MSDADIVREFVQHPYGWSRWLRVEKQDAALAALDLLEAERVALSTALDRLDLALAATERERDKALLSVEGLSKRLAIAVALALREET